MAYPNDGDPIRLRCLNALKTLLEGIRKSDGYYSDMAAVYLLQSEKLVSGTFSPAAIIVDDGLDERVTELSCLVAEQAMPLSVFLVVRGSSPDAWLSSINWLLSDVAKAIDADNQLGGLAVYVDIVGQVAWENPDDSLAAAEMKLRVVYRHQLSDPASV